MITFVLALFSSIALCLRLSAFAQMRLLNREITEPVEQDHNVDGIHHWKWLTSQPHAEWLFGSNVPRKLAHFVAPRFGDIWQNRTSGLDHLSIERNFKLFDFKFSPQRKPSKWNFSKRLLINSEFKDVVRTELFRVRILACKNANDALNERGERWWKHVALKHIRVAKWFVLANWFIEEFVGRLWFARYDQAVVPRVTSAINKTCVFLHAVQSTPARARKQVHSFLVPKQAPTYNHAWRAS